MFCYSTLGGAVCPGLTAPFPAIHSRECQLAITLTLVYLKEIQHFIAITDKWTHATPLKVGLSLMLIWDIVFQLNCFSIRKNVASCHPRASFKCICASYHKTHLLWGKVNSILHVVDFFFFMLYTMQISEWSVMKSLFQPCLYPSAPAIHPFKPLPVRGHHDPKSVGERLRMQHVKILFDSSKYTGAKSINSLTKYRSQPIVELTQIKSISLANKMRRALISESLIKAVFFVLCYEAAQ